MDYRGSPEQEFFRRFYDLQRQIQGIVGFIQQLNSTETEQVAAFESTTSTTYTDLATAGPSVTINVGASGSAVVSVSALTTVASPSDGAYVALYVDGTLNVDGFLFAAGSFSATQSSTEVVDGLSIGSHTFELKYKSDFGGSVGWGRRNLTVEPI